MTPHGLQGFMCNYLFLKDIYFYPAGENTFRGVNPRT
jgi:hypothetical protein